MTAFSQWMADIQQRTESALDRALPAAGDLVAINNSFGFGGHNVAIVVSNENVTD